MEEKQENRTAQVFQKLLDKTLGKNYSIKAEAALQNPGLMNQIDIDIEKQGNSSGTLEPKRVKVEHGELPTDLIQNSIAPLREMLDNKKNKMQISQRKKIEKEMRLAKISDELRNVQD